MSLLIPISIPTVSSANQFFETDEEIIRLADTRHRDLAGNFYDRTLEEKLLPEGYLGRLFGTRRFASKQPKDRCNRPDVD